MASRRSLAQSTASLSAISSDGKPCPHEVLFMQLTVLDFDKFLKNESKKRGLSHLKTIAFNGDMFRKANKPAFQAVAYFLTVKVTQLTKKTKWLESIKFPCQSHEDESAFRRNFMELIESLRKDSSFSTLKLPAIRIQLMQCQGDQLVLLLSKLASFILLHQLRKKTKDELLQRTMNNVSSPDTNQQHISAIKEALVSFKKIKQEMNQDLSNSLETFHELKSAISEAKSDYDRVKNDITHLQAQVEVKFGTSDSDQIQQILSDLSSRVTEKQKSLQQLMQDKFSVNPLTLESLVAAVDREASVSLSLTEELQRLLKMKSELDTLLAPVSRKQLLQLKERADDTLSRLSQHKAQAEENLASLTQTADDLVTLVNKQKSHIEKSEQFQESKRQADKLLEKLQIARLASFKFEATSPVNGVRVWRSLIPSVVDNCVTRDSVFTGTTCDQVRTSSLTSDGGASSDTTLCNINFDLSRLSLFSPIQSSPPYNEFSEHNASDLCKLLTDQLATSALIDASTESIED